MRLDDPTPYVTEVLLQAEMFEAEASGGGDGELSRLADTARVLSDHAPGDPGILAALLMNRVTLQPGQAMFLDAGNLHAYLHGAGVEIMANSDNVLRGGLTSKHVDVDALVSILDFSPIGDDTIDPEPVSPASSATPPRRPSSPCGGSPLRRTRRRPGDGWAGRSWSWRVRWSWSSGDSVVTLERGQSAFFEAGTTVRRTARASGSSRGLASEAWPGQARVR